MDLIIAQTYSNWTVYCVNDGSSDDTAKILNEYSKRDKRIRVFHTCNNGASQARNYALSKIENEEWVSFVDSDDYINPIMYETIFKAIDNNKDVDYVRLFCQHTDLRPRWNKFKRSVPVEILKRVVSPNDYFVNYDVAGYVHSCFVKANIIFDNGFTFNKDMVILEDQAFIIPCATKANKILVLEHPKNYFYYRGNELSLTHIIKEHSNDIVRCVNIVFKAFLEMTDTSVIEKYFYKKYLPSKLDGLCGVRLHHPKNKLSQRFLPEIRITMSNLSTKSKIKYIIVKLLGLL